MGAVGAATGAAGGNVLGSLMGQLGNLLGKDALKGIVDFMGSEGFSSLVKGGTDLYAANKTGDYLDFQKDLALKDEARNQTLFDNDQADRTARQNIDWTASTPAPELTQYT
jgi:hypothetical protein